MRPYAASTETHRSPRTLSAVTVDEQRKLDLLLGRALGKAGAASASAAFVRKSEEKAQLVEDEPNAGDIPEQSVDPPSCLY